MTPTFATVAEATAAFALLDAERARVTAALQAAQKQAKVNLRFRQEAEAARDTALAEVKAARAELKQHGKDLLTANARITALQKQVDALPERVNAEAARVIASAGHQPLNVGSETNPTDERKSVGKLTGRQKMVAAFEAQTNEI